MSTGVALTAFAPSFLWALLTYGVMVGLGTGAAYIAPLACAVMWFPNNKARCRCLRWCCRKPVWRWRV